MSKVKPKSRNTYISKAQAELIAEWEGHTGFEFMHKENVRANDPAGFVHYWRCNCNWLHNVLTDMEHAVSKYKLDHGVDG